MSVILITGNTGSGKTAYCVDLLAYGEEFKGRPLFSMGIPELKLDHEPVPPVSEWTELRPSPEDESVLLPYFRFPPQSVIVLDEAQRIFRPRPVGSKVPQEVQAFETHRHTGVDFILLTQHPNLIDQNIRRLVKRHHHVHETAMGNYMLEWPRCGDVDSKSERAEAARNKYKPPKRAFPLYKSAEAHTKIKRKIPVYVWIFAVALLALVLLVFNIYRTIQAKRSGEESAAESNHKPGAPGGKGKAGMGPVSTADYLDQMVPRIEGLAYTAPRYDEVTKPRDAPWPQLCMIRAAWRDKPETCRCLDQQGNRYAAPESLCRQIAMNGLFKDWGPDDSQRVADRHESRPMVQAPPVQSAPVPGPALPGAVQPSPAMRVASDA